jgi:arylsulfatase A-like enzyme
MRPNFLIFITDQHRADHLGCYGNPVVRTPNIDALARAGRALRSCLCGDAGVHAQPRVRS